MANVTLRKVVVSGHDSEGAIDFTYSDGSTRTMFFPNKWQAGDWWYRNSALFPDSVEVEDED